MRMYQFFCGNLTCPTRHEPQPDGTTGRLYPLTQTEVDAHDGQVWVCPTCTTDQAPK